MKKIFGFLLLILFLQPFSYAQIRVGLKFGASSNSVLTQPIDIQSSERFEQLKLVLSNANYGVHAGLFTQVKLLGFFVQPEVLFNSNSTDYRFTGSDENPIDQLKRESYQHLDFPLLIGFKLGPIQLAGGPVGHLFLNSTSELLDVQGYEQKFKQMTYGYQGNASIVLGKLYFDVRYENNFSRLGDHIRFFGNQYNFDKSPARIIGSIGIAF